MISRASPEAGSRALANSLPVGAIALLIGWLALVAGLASESRQPSPEAAIRGYLATLESGNVEAALVLLTPEAGLRWRTLVETQRHNRYRVLSVAARSPSALESVFQGTPWRPTQATLVAEVTEPSGLTWRGSTIVPVSYSGGRLLLARPPFAPG